MTILDKIVGVKRTEVDELPDDPVTVESLKAGIEANGPRRDFFAALANPRAGDFGLIAEVKKASPSKGIIREDFDPVAIAEEYENAGASCLSVLTDTEFFQGSLEYLKAIRAAVDLPLLRKDFMIDARQLPEAIAWGADAILLIVACLDDDMLKRLHDLATGAGLTALVEVHNEEELERALAINARLIGVNNRNLKTFEVDLGTTEQLAARVRPRIDAGEILFVAESGIHARADVTRLKQSGARAILVGESLMREKEITPKVHELLG
ncbi:MAG: indole-3-glycerol phosphate synthase TrpC [Limisphaerales bacterium]